jgi:hypothetical protein
MKYPISLVKSQAVGMMAHVQDSTMSLAMRESVRGIPVFDLINTKQTASGWNE